MNNNNTFTMRYTSSGQPGSIKLSSVPVLIGSDYSADVRLTDFGISQFHAQVEVQGGRVLVTDMGSTNGTFINGRQIGPNQTVEWLPGERLTVGTVPFELITGDETAAAGGAVGAAYATADLLDLSLEPMTLRPGKVGRLRATFSGASPQTVFLEATPSSSAVELSIEPSQAILTPGGQFEADVRVKKRRHPWLGARHKARFTAATTENLFNSLEADIRLRPRLGLIALLALLLISAIGLGIFLARPILVAQVSTDTPTPTETATVTDTLTPTRTDTPTADVTVISGLTPGADVSPTDTDTPTPTDTDTPTPTDTNTPTPVTPVVTDEVTQEVTQEVTEEVTDEPPGDVIDDCPNGGEDQFHVVARGQNLFRIAIQYSVTQEAIIEANNIPNRNQIYAGQRLLIPCGVRGNYPWWRPPTIPRIFGVS